MSPTFRFVGEWKDGAEHGLGTETWEDGTEWGTPSVSNDHIDSDTSPLRYVGMWENGKEHGQGTKTWADGSK
jgi:hypothetical protein